MDFLLVSIESHNAFKNLIRKLYAYSLKGLSKPNDRNIKILLTDIQALGNSNQTYCSWKDNFNSLNAVQYDVFLAEDDEYAQTIKKMPIIIRAKSVKGYRRLKKVITRIYSDIKKVCNKAGYFPITPHKEFFVALKVGFFAYREAIINIHRKLSSDLYQLIPSSLFIIKNNKEYLIKDLYKEVKTNNFRIYYQLDPNMNFLKEELRKIQLEIYPYIFKNIYKIIAK